MACFLAFSIYVLEASRTSGDNNATIIVGDAIRGAAWVAVFVLASCTVSSWKDIELTQPCGSAVGVEVVDLILIISLRPLRKHPSTLPTHNSSTLTSIMKEVL